MENIEEIKIPRTTTKRKNSAGPFMREQRKQRISGNAYKTGSEKNKPAKGPPRAETVNATGSPVLRTIAPPQKVIAKTLPVGTLARLTQKGPDGQCIQKTVRLTPSNVHNFKIINTSTPQKVQIHQSSATMPVIPQTSPSNQNTTTAKTYISPPILDHSGARKRQDAIDTDFTPEYKRRKTEKVGKGLRHFSMKVCEKVRKKGTTSYNEVADELVGEFTNSLNNSLADQQYDQKNIRRRVYDALNVLMAMNIISKEKKEIRWLGLPTNSLQECIQLEKEKQKRIESIRKKTQKLHDLILYQIAFKNLALRNQTLEKVQGCPTPNSYIQLPFIVVNTDKKTVIDCSISNDKMEYMFNFNDKFEIHDDFYVLKQIGMSMGLENHECSSDNLEKIKGMVPKALEDYVIQLARGSVDPVDEILESAGPGPSNLSLLNADDFVETQLDEDNSRQSSSCDPLSPNNQEFSDEEVESDMSSDIDTN